MYGTKLGNFETSLSQLCRDGRLSALKNQVDEGANIAEVDNAGNLLIHTAVSHDRLEILKWLVNEKRMNINATNSTNKTVLQIALERKNQSIIQWLMENEKTIKLKITVDNLCQAVQTNEIDIVKLVAKRIRNVCKKGTNGKTAIQLAYDMSNPEIKHLLSKRAFSFILRETASEQDKMEKLRQNLDNKTEEIYNLMVKSSIQVGGVSSGLTIYEKVPVVMLAAELHLMDIIKWLVEKGANPNRLLKSGSTLLAEIAWNKDSENFKWLVNKGADIYSKDGYGNFAIEKYVNDGNVEMVRWAVEEKNFDVMKNNTSGYNLIALSVEKGKTDIVKLILDKSIINVNMKLAEDKTLLHLAANFEHEDIVKKLIEANAEIDVTDQFNKTPIDVAVEKKKDSIVEILVISYVVKTIRAQDMDEGDKITKLKSVFSKYGYYYIQMQGVKPSSRDLIDEAKDLKLEDLAKWLKANATNTSKGSSVKLNEYNVLLIGETGVGKSTFINAFVNYINYTDLQDAAKSNDFSCLIPSSFAITDEKYEKHVITCGNDENEIFVPGQSSTQSVQSYSIITASTILRLIDTPGIGDTRGIEKDRENFDNLLKAIAELENIHAICVMLKPNNSRLTVLFEYCIRELFAHLDKSASENIVFLFTNSRGTFYRPGDSLPPLLKILNDLKSPPTNVTIRFDKNNVFCLDNEAFRFLLAKRKGVVFSAEEEQEFSNSWNKSANTCRLLVKYLINLKPHEIQNSLSINAARRLVLSLSKPLAEVAGQIDKITLHIQQMADQIELNKGNIEELRKNLNLDIPSFKIRKLPLPITGCLHKECAISYKILDTWYQDEKECHNPCQHGGIVANEKGHFSIRKCNKIKMWCEICQHSFKDHIHLHYKKEFTVEKYEDANLKLALEANTLDQKKIADIKHNIEIRKNQYREEENIILKAISKFSHFLKHNSIIVFNDVCKDYIQDLIREEEKLGSLKNSTLVRRYQNILKEYEDYFNDLENKFKQTGRTAVTSPEVFTEIDKLKKLEIFGENIRKLADAQLSLQKTELLPDTKVLPKNDTLDIFIKSLK